MSLQIRSFGAAESLAHDSEVETNAASAFDVTESAALGGNRALRGLLLVLTTLSLARIYYIAHCPFDLSSDEAHYWEWSRRLDLSYYSKGPLVAYIISASTHLFGSTPLGVRFPAVIFSLLTSLVVFFLTSDMAASVPGLSPGRQRAAGLIAALAIQGTPLFAVYGFGMTTDTPLILIWASALGLFWWTTKRPPEPGDTWRWVLLGATIGIGILAKYTMALFYGCALIYLLANHRENRRKYFWRLAIASVTTLIFCTPIIWWNFAHEWVTLRHVAGQADFYDGWRIDLRAFGEFVGAQFGIITPILLILLLLSLSGIRKTVAGRVLWSFSIPILIFFLLKSLQGKVQGNWVLPAYASAMPALGIFIALRWQQMTRASRAMVVSGFAVALAASIAIHFPLRVNRPFKVDPTARVRGWRQLGDEVSAIAANMNGPYFVFSDDFHIAPELSFYVRGQPQAYCANFGRRMTQYDIWPGYERLVGYNALMVTAGRSPLGTMLESQFDRCHPHLIELSENGVPLREYTVFECHGFKGIQKPSPSDY